jgi:hypothetical protein
MTHTNLREHQRIIQKYGSTGCGASILVAVKKNPQDNGDLQMS